MKQFITIFVFLCTIVQSQAIITNNSTDGASKIFFDRTFETMLPMRDGVKLHTRVVLPPKRKVDENEKVTTIIDRSPYGYTALEMIADIFLPAGFATIGQDMRGTQQSEGVFDIWHSDNNDAQDLGDWIVQQEWSNGKVFSFGASADGLASFTMPENSPDWLDAQYIMWSSSNGYAVIFPNGAYLEDLADVWIRSTVPDSADENLATIAANEAPGSSWWDPLTLAGKFDKVHGYSGFWAGWYDIFLIGNLEAYNGYNTQSDPSVRYTSKIIIDPLGHCQDGAQYFKPNLIAGRTALAIAQMFETYGVRPVKRNDIQNVTFYVMSSNDEAGENSGLYWTSMERFPTPTMTNLYLHADGSASNNQPNSNEVDATTYTYDPSDPVLGIGGSNLDLPCGPYDQSELDKRDDTITFTTQPYNEELPLTGPLIANLFVSSDAIDTDFTVKISDIYPTGEARLIQDSAFRMRWRDGGLTPVYMTKDEVYSITVSLWNTSYIVAPGHALRVSISSSNYPRFSVNRNNGLVLADSEYPGQNITAKNVIYHSEKYPSSFLLPVVTKRSLPKIHNIIDEVTKSYPFVDFEKIEKEHPTFIEDLTKGFRNSIEKNSK